MKKKSINKKKFGNQIRTYKLLNKKLDPIKCRRSIKKPNYENPSVIAKKAQSRGFIFMQGGIHFKNPID